MLFPGRTELVTLVKTGSRAGRTHSQQYPSKIYWSFIVQEYRVIAFTTEMYQWQFSPVDSSLPFALTDCPASYSVAQLLFEIRSRLLPQNKAATFTCVPPRNARAIHLASPVINKEKQKEIIFLPCLVLREARTKHE